MSNNIFQISQEYLELMNEIEMNDGDMSDEIAERFEQNSEDFNDKAVNYVKIMRQWEGETETISNEIKRLQALKKSRDNNVARLKNNLEESMMVRGLDKLDLGLFKLSFRKSSAVIIDDEAQVADKFKTIVENISIDKKALKNAIDSGEEIYGAHIEERLNLQIR